MRIDRDASTEKQIALHLPGSEHVKRSTRPFASKARLADPQGVRLILPTSAADEVDIEDDYIELRPSRKRKRGSRSPELASENLDYRSIEGKAKANPEPDDEDMEYTTESDDGEVEDTANRVVREQNTFLNRKVKDSPQNVDAWLALIEHQAIVVLPGQDPSTYTSSRRSTLADIRLAIYDRALKSVRRDAPGCEKLVLGRLKEGSAIWENSKIAVKWTEALKDNPSSIPLWTKYLDFVQTDHKNFRYEKCKETYLECFRMLDKAHEHADPEHHVKICSAQVYVLVRFTSFVRDAGYDELAHAIWQIVLENQFSEPPLSSNEEVLESLESFWESDVPRIGEEGARGWSAFHSGAVHGTRMSNFIPNGSKDTDVSHGSFAERESKAMYLLHLPAAADDEDDSEDPFRFVMFADLRDIVETLLNDLPKLELVDAFLCFMHLPPLRSPKASIQESPCIDPLLYQAAYNSPLLRPTSFSDLSHRARMKHQKDTSFSLFRSAFDVVRQHLAPNLAKHSAAMAFVNHALQRLVTVLDQNDDVAEYLLAFAHNLLPENMSKSAKRMLKLHPSSLRLYNAYALIEAETGNLDFAENVWAKALKMSSTWAEEKRSDTILLIHTRTMALMRYDQDTKALKYLIDPLKTLDEEYPSERRAISAAERLKATQMLREGFESMHASKTWEHATLYVDCLAWFSYLVDGHDLAAALAIYGKYIAKIYSKSDVLALELLHQARAEFLKMHNENKRPYKPVIIRDILAESIRQFPDNSLFYEVQGLISSQTRVDDRLRDALGTDSERRQDMALLSWCYTIAKEIERCSNDGSNATPNSVRAFFSKALLNVDSEVRHSPYLWTLWFQFELLVADETDDQKMPRKVFYDGLRYLPWYKPWIVMGMECLAKAPAEDKGEVRRLYDVMTEREMRIRTEVEN